MCKNIYAEICERVLFLVKKKKKSPGEKPSMAFLQSCRKSLISGWARGTWILYSKMSLKTPAPLFLPQMEGCDSPKLFSLSNPPSHTPQSTQPLCSFISLSESLFLLPTLTQLNSLVTPLYNEAKSQKKAKSHCRWTVRTSFREGRRGELLLNYMLY